MPSSTADYATARPRPARSDRQDLARLDERNFDVVATFVAAIGLVALAIAATGLWPLADIFLRIVLSTR